MITSIENAARMLGRIKTKKKAEAAIQNGKLGGPRCICGHTSYYHVEKRGSNKEFVCIRFDCVCNKYRARPRKKQLKKILENYKNTP